MARGITDRANLLDSIARRYENDREFARPVVENGFRPEQTAANLREAASMIRHMHAEKLEGARR